MSKLLIFILLIAFACNNKSNTEGLEELEQQSTDIIKSQKTFDSLRNIYGDSLTYASDIYIQVKDSVEKN
jgi:hypothetical protein